MRALPVLARLLGRLAVALGVAAGLAQALGNVDLIAIPAPPAYETAAIADVESERPTPDLLPGGADALAAPRSDAGAAAPRSLAPHRPPDHVRPDRGRAPPPPA